ncbi:hypothetical protein JL720_9499 [Aureococcus anophagefferens]|nr:hypothetical protein JL720_9499 [Aureococcus anophagefferens]
MSGYTQPARPRKDESPWAAPFAGMHTLQNVHARLSGENAHGHHTISHAARSRPPRASSASASVDDGVVARRELQAAEVTDCFRRLLASPGARRRRRRGVSPRSVENHLAGTYAPDLRGMNARELRLMRKCVAFEEDVGVEAQRGGPAVEYRGRLTGLALAPVLRAALRAKAAARRAEAADADDYAQFAGPGRRRGRGRRADDAEEADEADDETVELVVKRMTRHHEKAQGKGQPSGPSTSTGSQAEEEAQGRGQGGAGEAAVAKGRGRASTGDANADTALRIRNEDIQYNQDSFEAIALRMESEQTDEGGAEAPTVY